MSVVIVDYGGGNLRSVQRAIAQCGVEASITDNPEKIEQASVLILPGQGAIRDALQNLTSLNLVEIIKAHICKKKPFLGICLGMQLLFDYSEEDGGHEALGIFPGQVKKFGVPGLKVPHMGWNRLEGSGYPDPYVYFAHSYYLDTPAKEIIWTQTSYGVEFVSAVRTPSLLGIQFHPEKSGALGLHILSDFLHACPNM